MGHSVDVIVTQITTVVFGNIATVVASCKTFRKYPNLGTLENFWKYFCLNLFFSQNFFDKNVFSDNFFPKEFFIAYFT